MSVSRQRVIGLTGGIGSGKSTVAKILRIFGYPVFDADSAVKTLYLSNMDLKKEVAEHFGADIFLDEKLNAPLLAERIFNQIEGQQTIKKIISPYLAQRFLLWQQVHATKSVVFKEAAILIESGEYEAYDYIAQVTAPSALRLSRVMARSGLAESDVRQRMSLQLSDEERAKYCDFSILNDNHHALLPQIASMLHVIKA